VSIILFADVEDPRTNHSVVGNTGILDLRMITIRFGAYIFYYGWTNIPFYMVI
jgi:hypothetical protein